MNGSWVHDAIKCWFIQQTIACYSNRIWLYMILLPFLVLYSFLFSRSMCDVIRTCIHAHSSLISLVHQWWFIVHTQIVISSHGCWNIVKQLRVHVTQNVCNVFITVRHGNEKCPKREICTQGNVSQQNSIESRKMADIFPFGSRIIETIMTSCVCYSLNLEWWSNAENQTDCDVNTLFELEQLQENSNLLFFFISNNYQFDFFSSI